MAQNKATRSLGRPLPDAQRPRNPFDRSFRASFNAKHGHLDPIFQLWAPAGSHVNINRSEFVRTFDIVTSSFVPFDHFIDFFAVKISDLWSYWDNWYLNINDMHSSFGNAIQAANNTGSVDDQVKMRQQCPAFNMVSILNYAENAINVINGTGELFYGRSESDPTFDGESIRRYNMRRLLNRLRYPISIAGQLDSDGKYVGLEPDNYGYVSDKSNQYLNLFPLCAYQKIYYENYRNTSYEASNPFYYNLDWMGNSNNGIVADRQNMSEFLGNLTNLHSVNYRKDFFQSAYPALDYVPVDPSNLDWAVPSNVVNAFAYIDQDTGSDNWKLNQLVSGRVIGTNSTNLVAQGTVDDNGRFVYAATAGHVHRYQQDMSPSSYNVQAIRAAFALDKLKRATAYAPRHIKDQYEARFGFKYKGDQHHSIRIGSFKTSVTPYEVTQTSPGTDSSGNYQPLGTIGGKGVGSSNFQDEIHFDCSDGDYIIMGVSYFVARLQYDSLRFDPFVTKYALNHFFQPEFENLGLQPVYQKYLSLSTLSGDSADIANNIVRYYQTRYQEYKTGIDVNFGLFNRDCQLSPFVSHFNLDKRVFGLAGLTWQFFKALPDDVDNMFVTSADPTELTDQFFAIVDFKVMCTQLMSVHGQPPL